jgi:tol-pal system-associated acyl-CoA thioesterase
MNGDATGNTEFRWPLRVYIEDTDAGGIVYYVNYLKYMERARTEYLRCFGFEKTGFEKAGFEKNSFDNKSIFTEDLMFVVHAVSAHYHRPARLDDELIATARILARGAAQLRFEQRILRGSEELCSGEVKIVCVDRRTFKPRRIPSALLDALLTRGRD